MISMATERKYDEDIWDNPELRDFFVQVVPTDEKLSEIDGAYGYAKKVI